VSPAAVVPMQAPAASPQLQRELWISLASLLRSHVAMQSIARPSAALAVTLYADAELRVEGPVGSLSVTAPDASGFGGIAWEARRQDAAPEQSTYFFAPDGRLRWDQSGPGLELEAAVEQLLRKVHS
jgi:hypothetical protein